MCIFTGRYLEIFLEVMTACPYMWTSEVETKFGTFANLFHVPLLFKTWKHFNYLFFLKKCYNILLSRNKYIATILPLTFESFPNTHCDEFVLPLLDCTLESFVLCFQHRRFRSHMEDLLIIGAIDTGRLRGRGSLMPGLLAVDSKRLKSYSVVWGLRLNTVSHHSLKRCRLWRWSAGGQYLSCHVEGAIWAQDWHSNSNCTYTVFQPLALVSGGHLEAAFFVLAVFLWSFIVHSSSSVCFELC